MSNNVLLNLTMQSIKNKFETQLNNFKLKSASVYSLSSEFLLIFCLPIMLSHLQFHMIDFLRELANSKLPKT